MKAHVYKVRIYRDDNNDEFIQTFNNLNSAKAFVRYRNTKAMPWMKYEILTNDNKLIYKVNRKAFDVEFIKEEN